MKVKVGDNVKVLAGNDKGKTGKVLKTLKNENRVIVEGVHMVTKHMKPGRMGEGGGRITKEAPIHASNVKVIDEKTAKEVKKTAKKAEVKETAAKKADTTKKKTTKSKKKESDK